MNKIKTGAKYGYSIAFAGVVKFKTPFNAKALPTRPTKGNEAAKQLFKSGYFTHKHIQPI